MSDEEDRPELECNSEPVCPYCGYVERDAWEITFPDEFGDSTTEISCGRCDEEFIVEREVTVTYSTKKK